MRSISILALFTVALLVAGCRALPRPGDPLERSGDEIVAAGRFFHTGTRVVLWTEPGGYDAYRVEQRFGPVDESAWNARSTNQPPATSDHSPNRYGLRQDSLSPAEVEQVRGGGWDLPLLQRVVDQFVVHYDVAGISRTCFRVLHDERHLSVHFLLDLDGTIYQTLDLKERAWHASGVNDRSIGIEIANVGAYPVGAENPFARWYQADSNGVTVIRLPEQLGDGGIMTTNFVGRPARPGPVRGTVQGIELVQYDFTPEQYAALTRLTAALCQVFPKLECRYPVDAEGRLVPHKLSEEQLREYGGVLGHYHLQASKQDPGPAFDWDRVIGGAKRLLERDQKSSVSQPTRAGEAFRR